MKARNGIVLPFDIFVRVIIGPVWYLRLLRCIDPRITAGNCWNARIPNFRYFHLSFCKVFNGFMIFFHFLVHFLICKPIENGIACGRFRKNNNFNDQKNVFFQCSGLKVYFWKNVTKNSSILKFLSWFLWNLKKFGNIISKHLNRSKCFANCRYNFIVHWRNLSK